MAEYNKNLGKVCITSEGSYDSSKEYDRLSLVNKSYPDGTCQAYISRKQVPAGVAPVKGSNTEYWMWFSTQVTIGEITIDSDGRVYINGEPTDFIIDITDAIADAISDVQISDAVIQSLQTQINSLTTSVTNIGSTVNNLTGRVGAAETNISALRTQVNTNTNDIADLKRNQGGGGGQGGGGSQGGGGQYSSSEVYVITGDDVEDIVVRESPRVSGNITLTGEDVCAFYVFIGINKGNDEYTRDTGYKLSDFLNEKFSNAGIGAKVIIRSHMYVRAAGPGGSTDSGWDYDYSHDIHYIDDILAALNTYPGYSLFCATKVAANTWTAPCFIGTVRPDEWEVAPVNPIYYTLRINSVTPWDPSRSRAKVGIWNNSRQNYDYQNCTMPFSVMIPENTSYIIQVNTDYSDNDDNFNTWIQNGVIRQDITLDIVLQRITAYRILLTDGGNAAPDRIDDVDWMQSPGSSLGTKISLTSPSDQLVYEKGSNVVLLGIEEGYKTLIASNTHNLQSNSNVTVNMQAVTEKEVNLLEVDNFSIYSGGIKVKQRGGYDGGQFTIFTNFELLIECPSDKAIQIKLNPNSIDGTPVDISCYKVGTYKNNAKLVSFDINTHQSSVADNITLGSIEIGEKAKVSGVPEFEVLTSGTLDDPSPITMNIITDSNLQ